jgi:AbrB family looped-hinge helix DNA binding protein
VSQFYSSLSPKGQVTIPLAIRRLLKLQPRDRIEFRILDDQVVIAPARSALAAHYQSIPPLGTRMGDEEAIRLAIEEHASDAAGEGS